MKQLKINTENNVHFNDNQELFNKLVSLIQNNPLSYFNLLKQDKYSEILNWINKRVHKIIEYKLSTKCYWIISGLIDFPSCSVCNKKDNPSALDHYD